MKKYYISASHWGMFEIPMEIYYSIYANNDDICEVV